MPDIIPESNLQRPGAILADHLDDDHWNNIEQNYLLPALSEREALLARVAELEAQNENLTNSIGFSNGICLFPDEAMRVRIAKLEAGLKAIQGMAHDSQIPRWQIGTAVDEILKP